MLLSLQDVAKIAHLARLELSQEELTRYQTQLSSILHHITQISQLDLSHISPTSQAITQYNIWRADQITPSLPLDQTLFNAPDQADNQFKIQAILER